MSARVLLSRLVCLVRGHRYYARSGGDLGHGRYLVVRACHRCDLSEDMGEA